MLNIFYRENGKIFCLEGEKSLKDLRLEDVVWIDLIQPSGAEKHSVEDFLGTEIQSRAQAEEIESSSRYYEADDAIFANTNFLTPGPEEYMMQPVSFTIVEDTLTTLREVPLRSFTELQRRLQVNPKQYPSGFSVFASILDQRVDLDADMIELLSKEISQYSKRISDQEDIDEELLIDISRLQENTMIVRENVVDKQRLISNLMRSSQVPKSLEGRLNVLLQDISSLINHTNFCFERLEYLQELLSCTGKVYRWSYDREGNLLDTNCPDKVLNTVFIYAGCIDHPEIVIAFAACAAKNTATEAKRNV